MKKIIFIGLTVALCFVVTACSGSNENAPVEYEPTTDTLQIAPNPPPQATQSTNTMEETESVQPFNYSSHVGIWRGYAIATFQTLVITDVIEDEVKFLFVNVFDAAGFPDTVSPVYTMPIIDNQIILTEERTDHLGEQFISYRILTFYNDHIVLLRRSSYSDGRVFENEWRLAPIYNWSNIFN